MAGQHPKSMEWDARLKAMFDVLDADLEDRFSGRWSLRTNRPTRGETSNPEADGLFNVGAFFTPGYGSKHGRGYLVEIVVATEENVGDDERREVESYASETLRRLLPKHFPERRLELDRDGNMYKIRGDLSLGSL